MDFGVYMFPTDYAIRPDDLAKAVEERGFESLWFPEHTTSPPPARVPGPAEGTCLRNTGTPMTPS